MTPILSIWHTKGPEAKQAHALALAHICRSDINSCLPGNQHDQSTVQTQLLPPSAMHLLEHSRINLSTTLCSTSPQGLTGFFSRAFYLDIQQSILS
jgi:hypothetical protein